MDMQTFRELLYIERQMDVIRDAAARDFKRFGKCDTDFYSRLLKPYLDWKEEINQTCIEGVPKIQGGKRRGSDFGEEDESRQRR